MFLFRYLLDTSFRFNLFCPVRNRAAKYVEGSIRRKSFADTFWRGEATI